MAKQRRLQRDEVAYAEMRPDVYAGKTCDQVRPRWYHAHHGDFEGDYEKVLRLDCRHFPPGTRISIEEPLCPKCSEPREPIYPTPKRGPLYEGPCRCGFDWDQWVLEQYS